MIGFNYDTSTFINQLTLALIVGLLPLQLWFLIFRRKQRVTGRLAVKITLNVLLWLSVLAFMLEPYIQKLTSSANGSIAGKDISSNFRETLTDSLKNVESLDLTDLTDPSELERFDTLFLVGQRFETKFFQTLVQLQHQPVIKWIPYVAPGQLEDVNWRGILRKGEMQFVRGSLKVESKQILRIRFGNQTLDSAFLEPGKNTFKLKFPVFTLGRTSVELNLDNKSIDTLRFFARPSESLNFQFILDNPDFESRTLATWLGKNGHSVIYNAKLSKDVTGEININKAKDPDVLITDASNAPLATIKKAVANGKSIFFMGVSNPVTEMQQINSALHTTFQIRKISVETEVPIAGGLTAQPYHFVHSDRQMLVDPYPVAVENLNGKIGISLLNETFPLMLNGDSIAYQKTWHAIVAEIRPSSHANISVQAPVYDHLKNTVFLNNFSGSPKFMKIGSDTLYARYSSINSQSASAEFIPTQTGWNSLGDSAGTEVFVEKSLAGPLGQLFEMKDFVRSYTKFHDELGATVSGKSAIPDNGAKKKLSEWFWFSLVLVCLTAVWVEGKL